MKIENAYLTERQVAEMTNIGLQTLRNKRFMSIGIPYCKLNRSVRYSLADVIQYMEKHKITTDNSR